RTLVIRARPRYCSHHHCGDRRRGCVGSVARPCGGQLARGHGAVCHGDLPRAVVNAAPATKGTNGLIRIARREAAACWRGNPDLVITETGSIGFADAAEDDRARWLNTFRRLLDGLDDPLQVVIHARPGPDEDGVRQNGHPAHRLDDMRGADLWFAQEIT